MSRRQQYDLIIVGAGAVGLSCAAALANSSLKVAVVDAREPQLQWDEQSYDLRMSAITTASENFFKNLGVWAAIKAQGASAYSDMHVWDATGSGDIHFNCADVGATHLGHIIENRVIVKALYEKVQKAENIHCFHPVQLNAVERQADDMILSSDQGTFRCQLVVAADGARSWVREQVGFEVKQRHYGHHALVATVKTEQSHQQTAWQRFLPTGPLAFLPLQDPHYCSIVWSTSPEQAKHLQTIAEASFLHELTNAFEHKLGTVLETSTRLSFPLHMRHAQQYVQTGIALIGDAAHTIHPLAGQGMNLGLLDAASLADIVLAAMNKQRSISAHATLRRYERRRKGDNLNMIMLMEAFKQLFASEAETVRYARNIGLKITNNIPMVKTMIMRHAMGLRGELPTLVASPVIESL